MIRIDLKNRKSIYQQIVDGFKEEIVSGVLAPGDQLPSVRDLSARLTVNPNTIQKAFRTLESQGFIYPVAGRGNYVSAREAEATDSQKEEIYEKIEAAVNELRYLGVSSGEIMQRIAQFAGDDAKQPSGTSDERRCSDDKN